MSQSFWRLLLVCLPFLCVILYVFLFIQVHNALYVSRTTLTTNSYSNLRELLSKQCRQYQDENTMSKTIYALQETGTISEGKFTHPLTTEMIEYQMTTTALPVTESTKSSKLKQNVTFSELHLTKQLFPETSAKPMLTTSFSRAKRPQELKLRQTGSISERKVTKRPSIKITKRPVTKAPIPKANNSVKEIFVKGNTSDNWCYGLKYLYPPVINVSKIGGELQNISRFHKVVNPYSVNLLHNPKTTCQSSKDIYLISIVKSQVNNVRLRQAIRDTWGKHARSTKFRLVFSLGYSSDRKLQNIVTRESYRFNDILQGDFKDTYYNNSLKTMMGIHWMGMFCSSARYVFFVDDDVFVNFKNLLAFYQNVTTANEISLFSGNLKLEFPVRDKKYDKGKYHMPIEMFPYSCYPPYLSGAATLTSGVVVRMLNNIIPYVKKFKYDDVFIAIVIQKLGIRPQRNPLVSIRKRTASEMKHLIASHGYKKYMDYIKTYRTMTS